MELSAVYELCPVTSLSSSVIKDLIKKKPTNGSEAKPSVSADKAGLSRQTKAFIYGSGSRQLL